MNIYPPGSMITKRYQVLSYPMMGGMGVVYVCLDLAQDVVVALKTTKAEFLSDSNLRERFLREGETWLKLGKHPNIVNAYEVVRWREGNELYLVIEFIQKEEGKKDASLRSFLRNGNALSLEKALIFAFQIVCGMEHATSVIPGFIHRDLKPENILVGSEKIKSLGSNRVCVTDFGLAYMLHTIQLEQGIAKGDISSTQVVGTPLYMAPEQWSGESLGIYSDIYAFGCILFEMLTGIPLIQGDTIEQLRDAHIRHQIRDDLVGIPSSVKKLIDKCTFIDPSDRYPDWESVSVQIKELYVSLIGKEFIADYHISESSYDDRIRLGASYNYLGYSFMEMGEKKKAFDFLHLALKISEDEKNDELKSAVASSLGATYTHFGDPLTGIPYFNQALELALRNENYGEAAKVLTNWALCSEALGDIDKALEMHKQALKYFEDGGNLDGISGTFINLGSCYHKIGSYDIAIKYYNKGLEIAKRIGNLMWERNALKNLGNLLVDIGKPDSALGFAQQSLFMSRKMGDNNSEAGDLINLGRCYFQLKDYEQGINFTEQGLELAREVGNLQWQSNALGNLSVLYMEKGEYSKVQNLLEQSLEIERRIGGKRGEAFSLNSFANFYKNTGQPQMALNFYQQSIELMYEINDMNGIAVSLFNMALLHAQQGETAQALSQAQEAAHIWKQVGSPNVKNALQLIAGLQNGKVEQSDETQSNSVQSPFEAFQRAESPGAMQKAVEKYPVMIEDRFIQLVESFIKERVSSKLNPAFKERLSWLKQIAGKQDTGFLGRLFGKK